MKKFSEYLEAVQENRELEIYQEMEPGTMGTLATVGTIVWFYLHVKLTYGKVNTSNITKALTTEPNLPHEKEIKKLMVQGVELKLDKLKEEINNLSKEKAQEYKNKTPEQLSLLQKFQNLFKSSPNSK
jgi:hypothetical protein